MIDLKRQEILNWQLFQWPLDWTDNLAEFKILQKVALQLLPVFSNCDFYLSSFEEDYQLLELWEKSEKQFEIYVTDIEKKAVVLYSDEVEELYFNLKSL